MTSLIYAEPTPGYELDAREVLASPTALAGLERLGMLLRQIQYKTIDDSMEIAHPVLANLARGRAVSARGLAELLGEELLEALSQAGALDLFEDTATLRFTILAVGPVLTVVPKMEQHRSDLVYLGPDSFWLVQRIWHLATGGRLAVELGTGTGYIASSIARRYELTVATDVLPTTAAVAAMTFRLNSLKGERVVACVADVGRGLRPKCADLVVANAPWVPSTPGAGRRSRVFADGGPTGQELPMRFIVEASELLAPGGTAVIQCLDLSYADGVRPLGTLAERLGKSGLTTSIEPVGPPELSKRITDKLRAGGEGADGALVVFVIRRG